MADLQPFRGVRYSQALVGDLGRVLCPPYDVISPTEQRTLYQRSPYNAVRLEFGETRSTDTPQDNRYTRAARWLQTWLGEGMLVRESAPALYLVQETFPHQGGTPQRLALLARVRLEEFEKGVVLPHERTSPGPKQDRLELMNACGVNVSPIMALYRDISGGIAPLLQKVMTSAPLAEATPQEGYRYRLWAIRDAAVIDRIRTALASRPLYLADGHHRYETALAYRNLRRAASPDSGREGYDFGLMALIDMQDPGLLVLPYHRLLRGLNEGYRDTLQSHLQSLFQVQPLPSPSSDPSRLAQQLLDHLERRPRHEVAMGVVGLFSKVAAVLTLSAEAARSLEPRAAIPALARCDPWVLQEAVLGPALGTRGEEGVGTVALGFTHQAEEAVRQVTSGACQVAFVLRALPLELLEEVVQRGERLPPKSTYFFPKLITGLAFHLLDE